MELAEKESEIESEGSLKKAFFFRKRVLQLQKWQKNKPLNNLSSDHTLKVLLSLIVDRSAFDKVKMPSLV